MPTGIQPIRLENKHLDVSFDSQGRITSLTNKSTGSHLLTYPGLEDNWKILVLGDGHPVYYIAGRDQTPVGVNHTDARVTFSYRALVSQGVTYDIDVDFTGYLVDEEVRFEVNVANHHTHRIREVWYPILGGFEGFTENGQSHMVHFAKSRTLEYDILHKGLPGAEYLFVVDGETALYNYPGEQMQWIDLFCSQEGLYVSSDDKSLATTVLRLEKYPPEVGASGYHVQELAIYPPNTPRWMKIMTGKLTAIDPGETWQSPPAVFWPHSGDWHMAARHYRAWADSWMKWPERPQWLKNYVGWHHILGKTYLNEVYHTFPQFTEIMKEAQVKSGVDTLMIYGHTNIGCEGSDVDISPAENLGGREGFRQMCEELHALGIKVMVFTHRQSAINIDLPDFKHYAAWTIKDRFGNLRPEVWWKTTIESLMTHMVHYEATGPVWARICPYCDEWWETFLSELKALIALGLDGIQLDTIGAEGAICYATNHGHKPGTRQMDKLAERLAWLRREVRAVNPEFLMCGEEFGDWLFQYLDLPFSRYRAPEGYQVFRYTFPDMKENATVSAYGYDQANKSLMLGMGAIIEVWGLKKSGLVCPELMDYVNGLVKIRRAFPDYLMNGQFIDTLKASVKGDIRYSVHEGPNGLAAVVWNNSDKSQDCEVAFPDSGLKRGTFCRPDAEWAQVALPYKFVLEPHRAATIISTHQ